jgi:hypothetical protein
MLRIRPLVIAVFASSLLFVGGCDGHGRRLYLKPPGALDPPWWGTSGVIAIEGSDDVTGIVRTVAGDLGMHAAGTPNTWLCAEGRQGLTMSVSKEREGYWEVLLWDFPTIIRSRVSRRAEAAIRDILRQSRSKP